MLNLNTFRIISMIEGLSFLVLLFIAMPAKYHFGYPQAVSVAGLGHGLLFMLFIFMSLVMSQRHAWGDRYTLLVMVAGVLPFGCLFLEKSLRRQVEAAI
ncbi:MAG: DUF3817 domain-containing protein [Pseudomonadota bacterium]